MQYVHDVRHCNRSHVVYVFISKTQVSVCVCAPFEIQHVLRLRFAANAECNAATENSQHMFAEFAHNRALT